jgi:uronate dehydrogenase
MNLLVTGAAGRIGRAILPALREAHTVRTLDRKPGADCVVDLTDAAGLRAACAGMEVIVHLAAAPDDHFPFVKAIVPSNIVGLYQLLEAARLERVRRVVFASSCQTVGRYPPTATVTVADPVRPVGPYGASKVFGEALGRAYHEKYGLEFIALRFGAFQGYDTAQRHSSWLRTLWLSPRDCAHLVRRAVEQPGIGYAVVFGTSALPAEFLSLREAREILGYEPRDRWEDYFAPKFPA